MAHEVQRKNVTWMVIKFVGFLLVLLFIVFAIAKISVNVFMTPSKEYFGSYFYYWRRTAGDTEAITGSYKPLKYNNYPPNENFKKFLDHVQSPADSLLIRANFPGHYPRETHHHFTIVEKDFDDYFSFLKMRSNFCKLILGDKYDFKSDPKDQLKAVKNESDFKSNDFVSIPSVSDQDLVKGLFDGMKKGDSWVKAAPALNTIIGKLVEKKEDYGFDGDELTKDFEADVQKLVDCFSELKKSMGDYKLENFFLSFGTVKANPFETYVYSCLAYYFGFLISNADYEIKKEYHKVYFDVIFDIFSRFFFNIFICQKGTIEDAMKNYKQFTFSHISRMFFMPVKVKKFDSSLSDLKPYAERLNNVTKEVEKIQ